MLPRIANFDDLDPLKTEPDVELVMIPPGTPIPAEAALIVIPGTKATIADMEFLRQQGWDIDILAHHRRGRPILGICGGYQMLGRTIADPLGLEGSPGEIPGLSLLDAQTELRRHKTLRQTSGTALSSPFTGYEMHMGETRLGAGVQPFAILEDGTSDGAISADALVMGSYCHGLLASGPLRAALLRTLGVSSTGADHRQHVDAALNDLADHLEQHINIDAVIALSKEAP
jgi:adenosylcobyric acid synthase